MGVHQVIAVVGSGVAGSAIARELVGRGFEIHLLYRSAEEGASFTNQKWHHSGLLYPAEAVVKMAWAAYQRSDFLIVQNVLHYYEPARFLTLRPETRERRRKWLRDWNVRDLGLDWQELRAAELAQFPLVCGGFRAPDRPVDFPALIRQLRDQVKGLGVAIAEGAEVTGLLLDQRSARVRGVAYRLAGREHELLTDHTILAAGAWSVALLEQARVIRVPKLVRKKCVVLSYPGEHVPGITVCLDAEKRDGSLSDTTLVPFHGRTLAAGTDWKRVSDIDHASATPEEVEHLGAEFAQWFPELAQAQPSAQVCIKTEPDTGEAAPNVLPTVYGREDLEVDGLTVAFPGKASFMFELAHQVADGGIFRE